MGRSRYRAVTALMGALVYVAYAVACSSFESTPPDATTDGAADAPADTTGIDANSGSDGADIGDAGPDARDASLAVVCPIGSCRVVFVSSKSFTGDFGGLAVADKECDGLAKASGIPGLDQRTFRAWLSEPDAGAANVIHVKESKPYVRVDGVQVASGWNQLTSASSDAAALSAPIRIDEKGALVAQDPVWTGTTYLGELSGNTCQGWTKTSGLGQIGRTDQVNEAWTDTDVPLALFHQCSSIARLYCIEK